MSRRPRRAVLAGLGSSITALAGCAGTPNTSDSTTKRTTTRTTRETTTASPDEATTTTDSLVRTGPPTAGVTAFDEAVPSLLDEWDLPGASVAVVREGRLVFARGYGLADRERERPFRPGSLCRIGSIAKPITAVATLDLVERGRLSLDDRAFDLRADLLPEDGPADERAHEITVRQLLHHTAGVPGRSQGVMFMPDRIAREQGETPPASAEATIRYAFGRHDLASDPGSAFRYSNVGYCLLGRVIEGVTGDSYEAHVRGQLLTPLGADAMRIGATRRGSLADDEVRYYGHRTADSPFPDVGEVPRPYAAASLRANDADGGWIGSAVDLLRVVRGIDGRDDPADVLDGGTVETMTARPKVPQWEGAVQYYGMGTFVVDRGRAPSLWHDGSLPGSYAFLLHDRERDLTMAALTNSRAPATRFRQFKRRVQRSLIRALRSVESWPDRDLFGEVA